MTCAACNKFNKSLYQMSNIVVCEDCIKSTYIYRISNNISQHTQHIQYKQLSNYIVYVNGTQLDTMNQLRESNNFIHKCQHTECHEKNDFLDNLSKDLTQLYFDLDSIVSHEKINFYFK